MYGIKKTLLAFAAVCIAVGCSHPMEIIGEGDIISATGNRDCLLEEFQANHPRCVKNYAVTNYVETFTAVPRPGWSFEGWRTYCLHSPTAQCSFNKDAATVFSNWGKTLWPMRAAFLEDCAGPTCVTHIAPIQGAVTDTSIKFWQITKQDATFKVRYRIGAGAWQESSVAIDAGSGFVGTVELTGLTADTTYEYETQLNDLTRFTGTFSTLPGAGYTGQVRFGFAADFNHYESPYTALATANTKNFDFMFMIGDLIYADLTPAVANTAAAYADRYWLNWNEANWAALGLSTPMFMAWDDHEIYNDYWPNKLVPDRLPAARAAYDLYSGSVNPDPVVPGELYYTFSVPGADFFVLDTRSHRDPNTDVDDANKSMLGATQLAELVNFLDNSTADFKFIVSSVPVALGEPSTDTWYSYQTERADLLLQIETLGITNVAFISGDRHWSGAFRFESAGGYVYYDFLPSPAGTVNRPAPFGISHPGEDVIYMNDTVKAFGDFEIDLSGVTPTLRAAIVDENGTDLCVVTIGNDETGVLTGQAVATCM